MNHNAATWLLRSFLPAGVLLFAGACATTKPQVAPPLPFPSALEGPGRVSVDSQTRAQLKDAEIALRRGIYTTVSSKLQGLPSTPQVRLLAIQSKLLREPTEEQALESLQRETEITPGYASAWCTLSFTAEQRGLRKISLDAAEQCSSLWPKGPDADRYQKLRKRWVDQALTEVGRRIEAGQSALSQLEDILRLEPENHEALFLKAQSLLDLGRKDEAQEALAQLGDDPRALMLRSRIAMKDQQWQKAMDLLSALPESFPHRNRALHRAHMMWRLSILPGFVQQAANSQRLNRAEAATLLVTLAPDLEAVEGGQPPLMPDIVDLPSQRLILTAVRLEIMKPDAVTHLFEPTKLMTPGELKDAVTSVCHILGYQPPFWCSGAGDDTPHCVPLSLKVTGRELINIMLDLGATTT